MVFIGPSPLAPDAAADRSNRAGILSIGPAFFETMQIPLQAGREFDDHDRTGSALVGAVIRSRRSRRSRSE